MKEFLRGLFKVFTRNVSDTAVVASRTAGKATTTAAKISTDFALGFTAEFLTGIDKTKKELETSDDMKRLKEDWAYIIGKSDKPSAKSSYKRTSRPTLQSQRLMSRF